MSVVTKRRLMWCLVVGILTLPPEVFVLKALHDGSKGTLPEKWVASLSATERADAASRIAEYPKAYRRELLEGLTPQQRADVWRVHISKYLSAEAGLTAAQRAIVGTILQLHTPKLFAFPADRKLLEQLREKGTQATRLLGIERTKEIFFSLGPEIKLSDSSLPVLTRLEAAIAQRFTAAADADPCDCYHDTTFNYCSTSQVCSELQGCTWQSWGCGFSQTWPCDGLCKIPLEN